MARLACILLGLVSGGGVAYAFRLPSRSPVILTGDKFVAHQLRNHGALMSPYSSRKFERIKLSLSKTDGNLAEEIESLDVDLAREIDEALQLAQDALAAEVDDDVPPDEEDIDEIADLLMEKPPIAPSFPAPPEEEPPESLVSLALEEGADGDDGTQQPLPPESPPPVPAFDFGEALQKKAEEEMERLRNLIFGLNEELAEAEASTEQAEETADVLKKEIVESLQEREAMMKRIESEAAAEKELMVAQMEIASKELQAVMDQSAKNITEAKEKATRDEKGLISRIESFKDAIDKVTASAIEINVDKEQIDRSKQTMLEKVIKEGKDRVARFQKSFQFDIDYAMQRNADLVRRVDEAESKVRSVYDEINSMREERVSLQQQIVDVEQNALEEIAALERELESDEKRYATALQKERDRLDNVIEAAYQAWAIKICKKIVEREAVESEYDDKLHDVNMQIIAAKEKQGARVKEYLDKLAKKHKDERIALYQEKFEAVSEIRKTMNAELAIEYAKIDETNKTMRAKIDAVQEQTAQVKAEFETEMAKKRQIAKEEEDELLRQIEDVRVDMTDKIKTQRRLYEEEKAAYLEDMNARISESEGELRQRWRELAGVKRSYSEVSAKRDHVIDDVVEQQALIDSYETDRKSFRKSLGLTAKVAKEKVGSRTRRLLRKDKE